MQERIDWFSHRGLDQGSYVPGLGIEPTTFRLQVVLLPMGPHWPGQMGSFLSTTFTAACLVIALTYLGYYLGEPQGQVSYLYFYFLTFRSQFSCLLPIIPSFRINIMESSFASCSFVTFSFCSPDILIFDSLNTSDLVSCNILWSLIFCNVSFKLLTLLGNGGAHIKCRI